MFSSAMLTALLFGLFSSAALWGFTVRRITCDSETLHHANRCATARSNEPFSFVHEITDKKNAAPGTLKNILRRRAIRHCPRVEARAFVLNADFHALWQPFDFDSNCL